MTNAKQKYYVTMGGRLGRTPEPSIHCDPGCSSIRWTKPIKATETEIEELKKCGQCCNGGRMYDRLRNMGPEDIGLTGGGENEKL